MLQCTNCKEIFEDGSKREVCGRCGNKIVDDHQNKQHISLDDSNNRFQENFDDATACKSQFLNKANEFELKYQQTYGTNVRVIPCPICDNADCKTLLYLNEQGIGSSGPKMCKYYPDKKWRVSCDPKEGIKRMPIQCHKDQ